MNEASWLADGEALGDGCDPLGADELPRVLPGGGGFLKMGAADERVEREAGGAGIVETGAGAICCAPLVEM